MPKGNRLFRVKVRWHRGMFPEHRKKRQWRSETVHVWANDTEDAYKKAFWHVQHKRPSVADYHLRRGAIHEKINGSWYKIEQDVTHG